MYLINISCLRCLFLCMIAEHFTPGFINTVQFFLDNYNLLVCRGLVSLCLNYCANQCYVTEKQCYGFNLFSLSGELNMVLEEEQNCNETKQQKNYGCTWLTLKVIQIYK